MALGQPNYYFQPFHGKPVIGGYIARSYPPSLKTLVEYEETFHSKDLNRFQRFLEQYNIGYIIFYDFPKEQFTLFGPPHRGVNLEQNKELALYASSLLRQLSVRPVFVASNDEL